MEAKEGFRGMGREREREKEILGCESLKKFVRTCERERKRERERERK